MVTTPIDPVNSSDKYIGTGRINAYKAVLRDSSPIADLSYKLDNNIVFGNVTITGTAIGSNFKKYEVYYGAGLYPDEWTMFHTSDTPISNDTLAIWESPIYEDEIYFSIRLLVYDTLGQISEDRVILILDRLPTIPTIEGPEGGAVGVIYTFFFNSTDYDGDEIYYHIDWGDDTCEEWIGPYEPGLKMFSTHNWTSRGKYIIKAKARDIYGGEGDIGTFKINIPRSRFSSHPLFLYLSERYHNIFLFLKNLDK